MGIYRDEVNADGAYLHYEMQGDWVDSEGVAMTAGSGYGGSNDPSTSTSNVLGTTTTDGEWDFSGSCDRGILIGTSAQSQACFGTDLDANNQLSIECWVKFGGGTGLRSTGVNNILRSDNGWWLRMNNGHPVMNLRKTSNFDTTFEDTGSALSNDTLYHLVATWDGTYIRHYINGTLSSTSGNLAGTINFPANNNGTYIGSPGSETLAAEIDELAIYRSVLTGSQISRHYVIGTTGSLPDATITMASPPAITFTGENPDVVIEGSFSRTVTNAPDISLVGQDATVTGERNVNISSAGAANVTHAGLVPQILAGSNFTQTAFNGFYREWHSTPVAIDNPPSFTTNGTGYDLTEIFVESYGSKAAAFSGMSVDVTVPLDANIIGNATLTIDWQVLWSASQSNNQFQIRISNPFTVLRTIYNPLYVTGNNNPENIVLTSMVPGQTYTISITYVNNTIVSAGFDRIFIEALTLSYDYNDNVAIRILPAAGEITLEALDPSIYVEFSLTVTPDTPEISYISYNSDIVTPGQVSIGTDSPNVSLLGYSPSIQTERNVLQDTNTPSLVLAGLDSFVFTYTGSLSYKFVSPLTRYITASEAELLENIDLGSLLYNQEKEFLFRIGNTSTVYANFLITVRGLNEEFIGKVTFSTNKVDYYPSIQVTNVGINAISDVVYCKINADTDLLLGAGTFLISVEQYNV